VSVVISVRIPRWLKEKLEKYGVNIPELIKRKLLEELERIETEDLERRLEELEVRLQGKIDVREFTDLSMRSGERGKQSAHF
jgi:Ca2+-binding EF-hand superfamily protein